MNRLINDLLNDESTASATENETESNNSEQSYDDTADDSGIEPLSSEDNSSDSDVSENDDYEMDITNIINRAEELKYETVSGSWIYNIAEYLGYSSDTKFMQLVNGIESELTLPEWKHIIKMIN